MLDAHLSEVGTENRSGWNNRTGLIFGISSSKNKRKLIIQMEPKKKKKNQPSFDKAMSRVTISEA